MTDGMTGEPAGAATTKACPRCAEQVQAQAQVCRFCGFSFVPVKKTGSTVIVIVALLGAFFVIFVLLAILAVTFLGKAASSKFSSVGSTIGDMRFNAEAWAAYARCLR